MKSNNYLRNKKKHGRAELKERDYSFIHERITAVWEAGTVVSPQFKGLVTIPQRSGDVFPNWPGNMDHSEETELHISAHWVHVYMSSLVFPQSNAGVLCVQVFIWFTIWF